MTAAAAKSFQSCPTLCNPRDSSPPASPVPGILQARTPEWVAISFSNAWKWKVKVKSLSRVRLLATPWTAAYQAPPSMGFSRQEYWSGVPLPSPHLPSGLPNCGHSEFLNISSNIKALSQAPSAASLPPITVLTDSTVIDGCEHEIKQWMVNTNTAYYRFPTNNSSPWMPGAL